MMQPEIVKENNIYKNGAIWVLSIAAFVLISMIFYQHIKIKNIQDQNIEISNTITPHEKTTDIGESLTEKQEAEYEKTIKQLQSELKSLQAEQDMVEEENIEATSDEDTSISSLDYRKTSLNTYYSAFFQRLDLTTEQIEEFINIMMDAPGPRGDMENELRLNARSEEELNEGLMELEALAYEYDERMHDFLGDENYEKWVQYYNCRGIFESDPVESYEEVLSLQDDMIDQEQEDALVAAMAEEFHDFNLKFVPELRGPASFRINARDETTVLNVIKNLDYLEERYLDRAKPILSETQMKSYEVFIKSSFEERKEFGAQFFSDNLEE